MVRKRRNPREGGGGLALSTRDSQFFALWSSVRARLGTLSVFFRELQPPRVCPGRARIFLPLGNAASKQIASGAHKKDAYPHWVLPMAMLHGKWWISAKQSLSGVSAKVSFLFAWEHQSDAPRASHSIFSLNKEVLLRPSVCRFIFAHGRVLVRYSF